MSYYKEFIYFMFVLTDLNSSPSNLSMLWSPPLNSSAAPDLPANITYHLAPVTLRKYMLGISY